MHDNEVFFLSVTSTSSKLLLGRYHDNDVIAFFRPCARNFVCAWR